MPVEPRPSPMRRADDTRMERLEQKVDKIYDWLITEPEASPLGRILKGRADTNSNNIERLRDYVDRRLDEPDVGAFPRINSLEGSRDKAEGTLAATRIIQTLIAILVGALAVYQFAVPK